jgi:peroxiredoxin Q/BCP
MADIDIGSPAPDFTLETENGPLSLSSFAGKPVVVYFYPRDDTPGCTREAVAFSCLKDEFDRIGVAVIGISPDSVVRHGKFARKHELAISLAADEDHAVATAYGVYKEKSLYGRLSLGIVRSTFLVGKDGRIAALWRKVKVEGHAEAVLAEARKLAG